MKQSRAGHDNDTFGVCLNEFADEGWAFHEGSGQPGVVEGHSPSRLENELELALGRMRIFAEDFPEGILASSPHGLLDSLDAREGVFNQLVVVVFQEALESLREERVLGEPVWDRSLVAGDLPLDRNLGGHWGVVTAELGFGFSDVNGGVRPDLEVDSLPRED